MIDHIGRTLGRAVLAVILLLLVSALFAGCAAQRPAPTGATLAVRDAETFVERAVIQHLDVLHTRMQGHSELPTHEYGVCLRGRVTADSTFVAQLSAARVDSTAAEAVNLRCHLERDFIGVAHNHPRDSIGCAVSIADLFAFRMPQTEVVIHTCDQADDPNVTIYIVRRRGNYAPAILRYDRVERRLQRLRPL